MARSCGRVRIGGLQAGNRKRVGQILQRVLKLAGLRQPARGLASGLHTRENGVAGLSQLYRLTRVSDKTLGARFQQVRAGFVAVEIVFALGFFAPAARSCIVLGPCVDQFLIMARVFQRPLRAGFVAFVQKSGGNRPQHRYIVRLPRQHPFAILDDPRIVPQVNGGLHQRPLQFRSSRGIRELPQMILDRPHEFYRAVTRLPQRLLQAGLLILREILPMKQTSRE